MRRRTRLQELEDISGLSGWMYADLLLGLMVVFLATITFVPADLLKNQQPPGVVYSYLKVYEIPFTRSYDRFDFNKLMADVAAWKQRQGLSQNAYVVRARFVGSYSPIETAAAGINRALAFNNGIDAADKAVLKLASSILRTVPEPGTPRTVVEFTFANEVSVLDKTTQK